MRGLTPTDALLGPLLRGGHQRRPLLTSYDEAAGTRVELSAATTANWAAKTANMFVDEIGVMTGDSVAVDLPTRWPAVGIVLGAWWAGVEVRIGRPDTMADAAGLVAAFVAPEGAAAALDAGVPEVYVVGDHPLGLGVTESGGAELAAGAIDFTPSVRVHADDFHPYDGGAAVLDGRDAGGLLAAARDIADSLGLEPGARVLDTAPWTDADALIRGLVAPLVVGGSVVRVLGADAATLAARAAAENVTAGFPPS